MVKNQLTWQDNCGGSNRGGWDVQLLHDVLGPRQGHHPAEHLFHKVTKANQSYWLKPTFVPGVPQPGPGEALVFWASGQTSVISPIWRLPSYKGLDKRSLYSVHSGYLENHSVHLSTTKPLGIKVIERKCSLVVPAAPSLWPEFPTINNWIVPIDWWFWQKCSGKDLKLPKNPIFGSQFTTPMK